MAREHSLLKGPQPFLTLIASNIGDWSVAGGIKNEKFRSGLVGVVGLVIH